MAADNQKEESKKLKAALEEALREELEQIPSEEEIKKIHRFSSSFRFYMNEMIKGQKRAQKGKTFRKTCLTVLKAAACIICITGIGTLIFTMVPLGNLKQDAAQDESSGSIATEELPQDSSFDGGTGGISSDASEGNKEESQEIAEDSSGMEENEIESAKQEGENIGEQTKELKGWRLTGSGYDGEYYVEFVLANYEAVEMSYSPVYRISYAAQDENCLWEQEKESLEESILKPGEETKEVLYLSKSNVTEKGGVLEVARQINGEEVTLRFVLE